MTVCPPVCITWVRVQVKVGVRVRVRGFRVSVDEGLPARVHHPVAHVLEREPRTKLLGVPGSG